MAVAKAAAAHGGIYDVHMRNEADAIAESVEEVIAISERSGIPAMITHFKIRGKRTGAVPPRSSAASTSPRRRDRRHDGPVPLRREHVPACGHPAVVPQPGRGRPAAGPARGTRRHQA
ncbi:MAG: hypothetical protein ACLRWP_11055 [Bilophila wadsworthia]